VNLHRSPSWWLVAAILLLCALTPVPIARVAAQQVPQIGEVPDSLPEAERAPLRAVYTKLVAMRDSLRTWSAEHNARCGSVKVGSAEEQLCQQQQSQLIRERDQYIRAVNNFNEMLRAFAGENLGTDIEKWELAIKGGQIQAAIEKALTAATQRGELHEPRSALIKASLGPAMAIKDGDRRFVAQRVIVFARKGQPPVVDTHKFAELMDGVTVGSVALELLRNILSDNRIVTSEP